MRAASLVMVLGAAAVAGGCRAETSAPDAVAAVPVRVATAQTQQLAESFEAGGTVRARRIATLSSRIVAPVVEVMVTAGSRVKAGQTLLRLDGRQLDAARAGAEAALGSATEGAAMAAADAQAADAALALAAASHTRIARLAERNVATQGELDIAVAALRDAEARAKAAAARTKERASAIEAAREALRSAAVMASYAVVTAPFDGIVSGTVTDPGALATPGVPLATVEDTGGFRLEVSVDAARAGRMSAGDRVPVTLAGVDAPVDGTIGEISPSLDAAAHAFVVKIDLPSNPTLRAGLFGRARFTGAERPMLTVPADAVVRRGQLTLVYVEDRGTARMRFVRAGEEAGGRVAIQAGVTEGERVISAPPAGLRDGAAVVAADRTSKETQR